jgi:FtsP/CotA-like multicopper oxidase with cupredoxin domain
LNNELPDPTIIHWHGLKIPEEMDGHPRYAIAPGKSYDYDFQVINRAGMYWFHPQKCIGGSGNTGNTSTC